MCVCDELEHSSKCGGCAKLQASEKGVLPIVPFVDKQEYNGDGFPLVKLVKGRLDNVERNIVLFDSSRPFFTKLKSGFREIIIQRGDGSMVTIVKKLFDEGVFPPNETFEEVFAKVLEDYIHGLLWGVLITIYDAKNTTQYPILTGLKYNLHYRTVFDTGFVDGQIDKTKLRAVGEGTAQEKVVNTVTTTCSECSFSCGYYTNYCGDGYYNILIPKNTDACATYCPEFCCLR